jgi:hypothetical protein
MKKVMLILLVVFAAAAVASAAIPQAAQNSNDTLGAHLLYGRGCVGCHAPHSGRAGNNGSQVNADATSGNFILWGQDLTPLYNQTVTFASTGGGVGSYSVTLPASQNVMSSTRDSATIVILCLSCHDGNLAKVGMMKGVTVETLPIVGGNAPTLLGNDGTTAGNYLNDHPVGPSAIVSCGGQYNWDCTGGNTTAISMNGPNSSIFANTNYGFAVSFATAPGGVVTAVTCTSCHNQHFETIYSGKMGGTTGFYQTMFFLRGYYNPSTGGNNAAQFCRQCHGGNSNEMVGQTTVPTT